MGVINLAVYSTLALALSASHKRLRLRWGLAEIVCPAHLYIVQRCSALPFLIRSIAEAGPVINDRHREFLYRIDAPVPDDGDERQSLAEKIFSGLQGAVEKKVGLQREAAIASDVAVGASLIRRKEDRRQRERAAPQKCFGGFASKAIGLGVVSSPDEEGSSVGAERDTGLQASPAPGHRDEGYPGPW
jgi:hypothetical protein